MTSNPYVRRLFRTYVTTTTPNNPHGNPQLVEKNNNQYNAQTSIPDAHLQSMNTMALENQNKAEITNYSKSNLKSVRYGFRRVFSSVRLG